MHTWKPFWTNRASATLSWTPRCPNVSTASSRSRAPASTCRRRSTSHVLLSSPMADAICEAVVERAPTYTISSASSIDSGEKKRFVLPAFPLRILIASDNALRRSAPSHSFDTAFWEQCWVCLPQWTFCWSFWSAFAEASELMTTLDWNNYINNSIKIVFMIKQHFE